MLQELLLIKISGKILLDDCKAFIYVPPPDIDEQLLTSNLDDIPIDVATPVSVFHLQKNNVSPQLPSEIGVNRVQQQQKSMKWSSKSMSRLGEARTRAANSNTSG